MGNIRRGVRKGIVLALSAAMTLGLTSTFMGESNEVAAANTSGNPEGWLTKADLMTGDASGNMKITFGKDGRGNAKTWYVVGKDNGVNVDNTILYGTSYSGSADGSTYSSAKSYQQTFGTYEDGSQPSSVAAYHYGGSTIRSAINSMATDENYFSQTEQGLLNKTTITTYDPLAQKNYTVEDTLYLPMGEMGTDVLYFGTNNDLTLPTDTIGKSIEAGGCDKVWIRNTNKSYGEAGDSNTYPMLIHTRLAINNPTLGYNSAWAKEAMCPATNINLTNVLFASVAPTSASGNTPTVTPTKTNITSSDPNVLRLKMSKNYTITYNSFEQKLYSKILDGSCPQDLSYVIQGKDTSGNDVVVEALVNTYTTGAYDVSRFNINWDEPVKIWLEYTEDGITYATNPDDTVDTAVNYNITEGANSTWTKDSGKTLTFKGDGELTKFTEVRVDGTAIDASNYTTKSGSTIVTLKADYLNTLSEGEHNLAIYWNDGKASTTFTVAAASVNPNPGTNPGGDNQNPGGDNTGNNGNNNETNGGDNSGNTGNTGANTNNGTTIGDNNTWDKNTNTDLVVKPGNTIKEVIEVKIDGTTLDSKDYTLGSDGNITISKDYLKKLTNGNHTLQILGKGANGESLTISAGFVVKNSNALAPKTGETFLPYLWLASVALMLSVLASIVYDLVKAGRKRRA